MEYERFAFPQPMYDDVTVLRIGDTMVDTGHVDESCREPVVEALGDETVLGGVDRVLITHPHIDHVGGSLTVDALTELPHVVPEGVPERLRNFTEYLQRARAEMTRLLSGFELPGGIWDTYFPVDKRYAGDEITIERTVADGDVVTIDGHELEAIHTPGHVDHHLAFHHEPSGTCLSGDLVSHDGYFTYGPLFADVGAYKESLHRLRELEPAVMVPMHGPPMHDPAARIDRALERAESTEASLLAWLDDPENRFARHYARDVIGASPTHAPFLTLVVVTFAQHLAERGLCTVTVTDDGVRIEAD